MDHIDKVNAIKFIRPNSQFKLNGDELEWLDENQTEPTKSQIEKGLIDYTKAAAEAKAKAEADKAALLARLGLTEDELKTILG